MLQMFKLVSGTGQLDGAAWFRPATVAAARTRQNADELNVRPNYGCLEIRHHFFTVRAGERWNAIPAAIKRARTANSFKKAYAKYREEMI
jgi:hypothetical protein